jgi:hypothetical protein
MATSKPAIAEFQSLLASVPSLSEFAILRIQVSRGEGVLPLHLAKPSPQVEVKKLAAPIEGWHGAIPVGFKPTSDRC